MGFPWCRKPQDTRPHCHLVARSNFATIHFESSLAFDLLFKKWKCFGWLLFNFRKNERVWGTGCWRCQIKTKLLRMPNLLRKAISPAPSVEHSPTPNDNLEPHMSSPQLPKVQRDTSELPRALHCLPWNSVVPFSQYKISKALEM